jgi:hypothetical protein
MLNLSLASSKTAERQRRLQVRLRVTPSEPFQKVKMYSYDNSHTDTDVIRAEPPPRNGPQQTGAPIPSGGNAPMGRGGGGGGGGFRGGPPAHNQMGGAQNMMGMRGGGMMGGGMMRGMPGMMGMGGNGFGGGPFMGGGGRGVVPQGPRGGMMEGGGGRGGMMGGGGGMGTNF